MSLDNCLVSMKISAEVKTTTCEMCKGNILMLPCGGPVWRGCSWVLCLRWETLGCWNHKLMTSFTHLWKSPLVLLEEQCLLPFQLNSWTHLELLETRGSVREVQEAKHRSACIWCHKSAVWWILFGHCGFRVSFRKGSHIGFVRRWKIHKLGKGFPHRLPENVRLKCVTVCISCSCISKPYVCR